MYQKNIKRIIKWLMIGIFILIILVGLFFIPQKNANQFKDWATYSYKTLYFKYPTDFVVIFDSLVANQLNGFDLHVEKAFDGGMVPDGLYLSTSDMESDNIRLDSDRKFIFDKENGQDRFKFTINGTTIYAGCSFHIDGQTTVDLCNKIISTLKIRPFVLF